MPPVIPNQNAWLAAQIAQLKRDVAALKAQQTQYVVDASGTTQAIIGNLTTLPSGGSTGRTGFGIASFQAKNAGYTAATLINSWVSGGEGTPGYLKDALGFVHLRGYLTTGTSGTVAFVLPAGFRPGATTFYPSLQGSGVAGSFINIDTSGNVTPTYTTAGARLTAVTFLAEN